MTDQIPSYCSPASTLCVCGILLMVICIVYIMLKGFKAWAGVVMWAVLGGLYFGLSVPSVYQGGENDNSDYQRMVQYDGQWRVEQELLAEDKWFDFEQEPVLQMHVNGTDPWVWHPACLFYSPFFACVITAIPVLLGNPALFFIGLKAARWKTNTGQ